LDENEHNHRDIILRGG